MAGRAIRMLKTDLQDRMHSMVKSDDLYEDRDGDFVIRHAQYGDYSGSIYDRANHDWLVKNFPDIVTSAGSDRHGNCAYVSRSVLNDYHYGEVRGNVFARLGEVLDIVAGLNDYPIICEESLSETEQEVIAESWDSYYRREFGEALSAHLEKLCPECVAWEASEYGSGVPQCPVDHSEFEENYAFQAFADGVGDSEVRATEVQYMGDMTDVVLAYLAGVADRVPA